jgi:cobalt/nickel transport system ATP-binding protein
MRLAGSISSTGGCPVSIRGLGFAYPGGRTALDGVSFEIAPGERLGIIGASGAGKSTFLLHLNGVHLATSGEVTVGGIPVGPGTLREVRSKVGIVFQNPDDQLFTPTVEEDVAFGPLNMGCTPQEVRDRVTEALAQMRLEEYRDRGTHELSHGEKRRVALATVLAMRPQVIGFDEPFANLDPGMVEQLIEVIGGLPATVVVISQEIIPVVACCDRIAVFHHGRVAALGPSLEIAANRPLLAECGIDFHYQGEIWRKLTQLLQSSNG